MANYAIIRRNGLGDFIAGTVPLINYLINNGFCKEKEVFLFCSIANAPLVKYFFKECNVNVFKQGNKYLSVFKTIIKNRNKKYDIGIIPIPDYPKLSSLFLYGIGCKDIYGRIGSSWIAEMLVDNKSYVADKDLFFEHVSVSTIRLYKPEYIDLEKECYPKFNKSIIKPFEVDNHGPYLFVEVSNNRTTSQLSNANIAAVCNELEKQYDFSVLISAKRFDLNKANELMDMLNVPSEVHITNGLDEFVSYVDKADVVFTGDGGLGHIAGALGKNVVALYGGTSVQQWGILGENCTHLYDDKDVNNIDKSKMISEISRCFLRLHDETNRRM